MWRDCSVNVDAEMGYVSEEKVSVLVEDVCGCVCVGKSRHSMGLSMCRERLDHMRVCVCGELEMFVSVERMECVWREPTGHRCVHRKLSVLCVKVLRVSREFWREGQARGVCVEGEMGLCVCLCVEIRVCVWRKRLGLWKESQEFMEGERVGCGGRERFVGVSGFVMIGCVCV